MRVVVMDILRAGFQKFEPGFFDVKMGFGLRHTWQFHEARPFTTCHVQKPTQKLTATGLPVPGRPMPNAAVVVCKSLQAITQK